MQSNQRLEEEVKYATVSVVDGVRHMAVFVMDEESRIEGFVNFNYFFASLPFSLGKFLDAPDFHDGKHFILDGTIVVYPDQVLRLFSGNITVPSKNTPPAVRFKIFAEGMLPREGEAA